MGEPDREVELLSFFTSGGWGESIKKNSAVEKTSG